jgi:photosystem II stability/assembly factor-like uncharacterized protein
MSSRQYGSNEGSIFVQPDGPNTKPQYLGCHDLGDLDEPLGDPALWQCKDPNLVGQWETSRVVKGSPGLVTTSITTDVRKVADYMENLPDNSPVYINLMPENVKPDVFDSYDRAFAARFLATNRKRSNLAMGRATDSGTNERAEQVIDLSGAPPVYAFFDLAGASLRISTSETLALNNIVFCDAACSEGFIAADGGAAAANVLGIPGFAAVTADPFAVNQNIVGAVCFPIDKNTTRWLVARGTSAAAPAAVAYSDDGGATWTSVNVGATNTQIANDSAALFALDQFNIWYATDDGFVYKSEDGGLSWTAQEKGVITSSPINAVYFKDPLNGMAGGDGDVLMRTMDGGLTWAAVTATGGGDDITAIANSGGFWWAADSGGQLWYSDDDGLTWNARTFNGSGTGNVAAVKFANEFFGVMAHNTAAPVGSVFVTVNGGYTWQKLALPTNAGINDIWICSTRKIYVVGEAQGGTGFIAKIEV